ncbi:MAG: proton-conducting transporter membrane subunit [Bacillota bacterium]|nr:proton-conducting transporter membrane subunit [Bacillota bacterium]
MVTISLALLPVIAPLIVSPVLLFISDRWRRTLLFVYLLGMILVAVYILSGAELGSLSLLTSTFGDGSGMAPLFFSEHPYGKIAAFGFILVGAFALLYGLEVAKPSEQAVSVAAIGSAVGIAFSGNFLTLFIFWEMLTITVAGLIMLQGTPKALSMGYRFLLLQLGGGLCLFLGIMQHYAATGSLLIAVPAAGLPFFIIGIGMKSVFLPLHIWLPWAYPTASFASSVVLAGLTTKVGVFAVARILPPHQFIAVMGASMALFGVTCALLQSDLRRLLSYHIISQVGFMVAGVGLGSHYSVDGGLLHLVNHMLYKALLFMSAGALIYTTGKHDLHDFHEDEETKNIPQIWLTVPVAALGAVIGALAISGTPLFNGFVSKYLLKKAVHGVSPVEWMLMVAGVGTSISFCKFVYFGFIKGRARVTREITSSMRAAILALSGLCILFGIWPQLLSQLLPYGTSLSIYSLKGAWAALQIILIGIFVFTLIARVLERGIHIPAWFSVEYLLYRPVIIVAEHIFTFCGRVVDTTANGIVMGGISPLAVVSKKVTALDDGLDPHFLKPIINFMMLLYTGVARIMDKSLEFAFVKSLGPLYVAFKGVAYFDEKTLNTVGGGVAKSSTLVRDGLYNTYMDGLTFFFRRASMFLRRVFVFMIRVDYDPKGEPVFQVFNLMNFDLDFIIIMGTLLLLLGVSLFIF